MVSADSTVADLVDPPLRQCQKDCLEACAKGARKIEMACGTGKTRVMKELVSNVSGRVAWLELGFLFCSYYYLNYLSKTLCSKAGKADDFAKYIISGVGRPR